MKTDNMTPIKHEIQDILMSVSWREFANTYFQKPASWFYEKVDSTGFNKEETEQLRNALYDLSLRIRSVAEKI